MCYYKTYYEKLHKNMVSANAYIATPFYKLWISSYNNLKIEQKKKESDNRSITRRVPLENETKRFYDSKLIVLC